MEFLPLVGIALIAVMAVPLSVIDFREHRLPNRFTYPAIAANAVLVALSGLLAQEYFRMVLALGVAAITFGIGYLLSSVNGIGMGDVKLLVAINASVSWFSPIAVLVLLAIAFTAASIVSLVLIVLKKASLKSSIAMGPFLLLGFGYVGAEIALTSFTAVGGS